MFKRLLPSLVSAVAFGVGTFLITFGAFDKTPSACTAQHFVLSAGRCSYHDSSAFYALGAMVLVAALTGAVLSIRALSRPAARA